MNETPFKLAVLGPRQSGKTCLVVGLSSVNDAKSGFAVEAGSELTDAFLAPLKNKLQGHEWPAQTSAGDTNEIILEFLETGKTPFSVSILDYGGERIQTPDGFKVFAKKHLRDLDGAVVLVNPGADAFKGDDAARQARQELLGHYRRMFRWIRSRSAFRFSKPLFALTVTASDRLAPDGDLVDRKDVVDQFVAQLANLLKSGSCKRFDVTITGHLEDQSKPELAEGAANTSAEPFRWLHDTLEGQRRHAAILKKVFVGASLAIGLALLGGIWCAVERNTARKIVDGKAETLRTAIHDKKHPRTIKTKFDELLENPPLFGRTYAEEQARPFEPCVWEAFNNEIDNQIRDIGKDPAKKASPDAIQEVDDLFKFVPQDDKSHDEHQAAKNKWDKDKLVWVDQYAVRRLLADVNMPLEALAGRHGDEVPPQLFVLYGRLREVNVPEGSAQIAEEKHNLEKRLDERTKKEFQWLVDQTFAQGLPKDESKDKATLLRELLEPWTPATGEGKNAKRTLEESLTQRVEQSENAWEAAQRNICDDWVKEQITKQPDRSLTDQGVGGLDKQMGLFSAYQAFAKAHTNNPFFAEVVQRRVYDIVEREFTSEVEWFVEQGGGKEALWTDKANFEANWRDANTKFDDFRDLCRAVSKDITPLRISWAWQFASLCRQKGKIESFDDAFPQQLVITQIVASVDYFGDLPKWRTYKGTAFGAKIDVTHFNGNGTVSAQKPFELLPFEKNGEHAKCDEANSVKAIEATNKEERGKPHPQTKVLFSGERKVPVHAFERVSLQLIATDWNHGVESTHSFATSKLVLWGVGKPLCRENGTQFDLSFDIDRNFVDEKPKAIFLTIYGRVDDDCSMTTLLNQAKEAAKQAKTAEEK